MELFDTHFVWVGQVLLVSGLKMLVVRKSMLHVSGKITTVPQLFSRNSPSPNGKHQIVNVHTKWNCLIPILSSLVKYCLFRQ